MVSFCVRLHNEIPHRTGRRQSLSCPSYLATQSVFPPKAVGICLPQLKEGVYCVATRWSKPNYFSAIESVSKIQRYKLRPGLHPSWVSWMSSLLLAMFGQQQGPFSSSLHWIILWPPRTLFFFFFNLSWDSWSREWPMQENHVLIVSWMEAHQNPGPIVWGQMGFHRWYFLLSSVCIYHKYYFTSFLRVYFWWALDDSRLPVFNPV